MRYTFVCIFFTYAKFITWKPSSLIMRSKELYNIIYSEETATEFLTRHNQLTSVQYKDPILFILFLN